MRKCLGGHFAWRRGDGGRIGGGVSSGELHDMGSVGVSPAVGTILVCGDVLRHFWAASRQILTPFVGPFVGWAGWNPTNGRSRVGELGTIHAYLHHGNLAALTRTRHDHHRRPRPRHHPRTFLRPHRRAGSRGHHQSITRTVGPRRTSGPRPGRPRGLALGSRTNPPTGRGYAPAVPCDPGWVMAGYPTTQSHKKSGESSGRRTGGHAVRRSGLRGADAAGRRGAGHQKWTSAQLR